MQRLSRPSRHPLDTHSAQLRLVQFNKVVSNLLTHAMLLSAGATEPQVSKSSCSNTGLSLSQSKPWQRQWRARQGIDGQSIWGHKADRGAVAGSAPCICEGERCGMQQQQQRSIPCFAFFNGQRRLVCYSSALRLVQAAHVSGTASSADQSHAQVASDEVPERIL